MDDKSTTLSPLLTQQVTPTLPKIPVDIADKIINCKIPLVISTSGGPSDERKSIFELVQTKALRVLTFTPGPFLSTNDPLPNSWAAVPGSRGCTKQLQAFNGVSGKEELASVNVHCINVRPVDKQLLLFGDKNISNIIMIGFPDQQTLNDFVEECGIPLLEIDGGKYMARFSVVVTEDKKAKLVEFES